MSGADGAMLGAMTALSWFTVTGLVGVFALVVCVAADLFLRRPFRGSKSKPSRAAREPKPPTDPEFGDDPEWSDRAARLRRAGGGLKEEPPGAQSHRLNPAGWSKWSPGTKAPDEVKKADRARPLLPHQVLGIPADASLECAKAAFRELARRTHPDRFERQGQAAKAKAEQRFIGIKRAYDSFVRDREGR